MRPKLQCTEFRVQPLFQKVSSRLCPGGVRHDSVFGQLLNTTVLTKALNSYLFFTVQGTTNLNSNFTTLSSPISENATLAYTDAVLSAGSAAFYRVAVAPAFTALNQPGAFTAYAATNVNGLNTAGYAGAVFDGRYVYFVPYQNSVAAHGRVLRLDTQGSFMNAASWQAFDAGHTGGLPTQGYVGAVSDGRYLCFAPYANTNGFSGHVLRFDSHLPRSIPPTVTGGSNL